MKFLVALIITAAGFVSIVHAQANDTEPTWGCEDLLGETFNSIRNYSDISIDGIQAKDAPAVLERVKAMPKLQTLKLYNCDLSNLDAKSAVPDNVKSVVIADCKFSQDTIRWLARFPKGNEIVFGGNMRGLSFDDLGKFSWLTFDNCTMSSSAIVKLVSKYTQVTFKEIKLIDDK